MQYTPKKGLTITTKEADTAAGSLLAAIHYFRRSHGLPLEGSRDPRAMNEINGGDTCEYCILNAARALGIDLGSERPGELDVRAHS